MDAWAEFVKSSFFKHKNGSPPVAIEAAAIAAPASAHAAYPLFLTSLKLEIGWLGSKK